MTEWLAENLGTLIVGLILAAAVAAALRKIIHDFRSGKGSCGCGCDGCAAKGSCHARRNNKDT